MAALRDWWVVVPARELVWLSLGMAAQLMFTLRFVVQWVASERARRSVVPDAFWAFSFAGGAMLLIYAVYRMDPVFIVGQAAGLFIYSRNLFFLWQSKHRALGADHLGSWD